MIRQSSVVAKGKQDGLEESPKEWQPDIRHINKYGIPEPQTTTSLKICYGVINDDDDGNNNDERKIILIMTHNVIKQQVL